jgi:hypothetical protein
MGRLSEPASCLDQKKICAGMRAEAIDQWIAGGGAVRIESAACGTHPYDWREFAKTQDILNWCDFRPDVRVNGRRVDYSFVLEDGKISSITIQRRTGAYP